MKSIIGMIICSLLLVPIQTEAAALAPSIFEVSAVRGSVVTKQMTVFNQGSVEKSYYLGTLKFVPTEDGSGPNFVPYEEDHTGLPEWISFPFQSFVVAAYGKLDIPFEIAIPSDATSGGYYGAMTVSEAPSEMVASNGAIIEAKTAILILLTVEGETQTQAELLDFSSDHSPITSLIAGTYTYRIQNQGNVHIQPSGRMILKDLFGRELKSFDANPERSRVLPLSTRKYEITSDQAEISMGIFAKMKQQIENLAIGPVTASLELTYGNEQKQIHAQKTFWLIPWQLLLGLLFLVGLFSGCIKLIKKWY